MDDPGAAAQGCPVMRRWFDNSPIQRLQQDLVDQVRQLGFRGCEVVQIRMDSFKAVVQVAGPGNLVGEFQDGEYDGVQWGNVRVVWRRPVDENKNGDD